MNKWDNFWLGLLVGLALPALFCVAYAYTIHLPQIWEPGLFNTLKPVIGQMLLLGSFTNMAAMFILYQLNIWRFAKGVFVAILPYLGAGILLM